MAKYKGPAEYSVVISDKKSINFDGDGEYVTEDKAEIKALDKLCPTWIQRIDESEEVVEVAEISEKPAAKRKNATSAK